MGSSLGTGAPRHPLKRDGSTQRHARLARLQRSRIQQLQLSQQRPNSLPFLWLLPLTCPGELPQQQQPFLQFFKPAGRQLLRNEDRVRDVRAKDRSLLRGEDRDGELRFKSKTAAELRGSQREGDLRVESHLCPRLWESSLFPLVS